MSATIWADAQTIYVELAGLVNLSTGVEIDDAEVEFTIYEENSTTEVDGTWPVTMTARGSDGYYSATCNTDLDAGDKYTITMSVTSGTNLATFSETVLARVRRF